MANLGKLADQYGRHIDRLLRCCDRVDGLVADRSVGETDRDLVYESSFLALVAHFESFLEEILVETVCGEASRKAGRYRLVGPRSRPHFREILYQGRQFVQLLPYGEMLRYARLYLNDGHPFTDVADDQCDLLSQAVKTRNAIAHRSRTATVKFRRDVPGVDALPRNRQRPGP